MFTNENKMYINNLRLQFILYYLQVEYLVRYKTPCFKENIIAWSFGTVVTEVYKEYRFYGSSIIYKNIKDNFDFINSKDKSLFEIMTNEIYKMKFSKLVDIVHNQKPYKDARMNIGRVITNYSLWKYFK